MHFKRTLALLSCTLVVNIFGSTNAFAIQGFVVEKFCPAGQQLKGKFVGSAVEKRLPSGPTFQGVIEMTLNFCNEAAGISRHSLKLTFGNVSVAPNVIFNNVLGIPAPFSLGQPSFTYQVGPVVKTVTSVTGNFLPNGKATATMLGTDVIGSFQINWIGTFVPIGAVGAESATSEALQDFFLQEAVRFTRVVNPSSFLQSYRSGPVASSEPGEVQFARTGRGLMTRAQSAGDDFLSMPWGMWASFQHSDYEDDFTATAFAADSNVVLLGLDVSPREDVIAGFAVGYEVTDIESAFNGGGQNVDGFTVVPYLGGLVDIGLLELGLDASIGFSRLDIEQFRTSTTGAGRITSDTTSNRWFLSANANVNKTYGDWTASGRAGIILARDKVDAFTESDGSSIGDSKSSLGRLSVGGDLSYFWNSFEPFVSATYEYDYDLEEITTLSEPQPANDNDDFLFGAGVRWYSDSGLSAGFEYNTVLGRDNFNSDTFNLRLRADF